MKRTGIVGISVIATILISGISYYAINYRYISHTTLANNQIITPVNKSNNTNSLIKTIPTTTTSSKINTTTTQTSNTTKNPINPIIASQNINIAKTANLKPSSNIYILEFKNIENRITQILKTSVNDKGKINSMVDGNITSANLWNAQIDKILLNIQNNLGEKQLKIFNEQIKISKEFIKNEVKETQNAHSGGSMQYLESATQRLYMSGRAANFLLYNYIIDNGENPQFTDEYASSNSNIFLADNGHIPDYTPQQLDLINQYKNEFLETTQISNNYINAAKQSKISMTTAYNNVLGAWNDTLNDVYQELSNVSKQSETPYEYDKIWLNYKKQMVNLEGQMYSNPLENELAKKRMSIRLTQMESYNLLNQFASSAFLHH